MIQMGKISPTAEQPQVDIMAGELGGSLVFDQAAAGFKIVSAEVVVTAELDLRDPGLPS